jgi:hypothetical protein
VQRDPTKSGQWILFAVGLIDGRWFRVLTVVDRFTRECLVLLAGRSLTGHKVALALLQVVAERGAPVSITVKRALNFDGGTGLQCGVQLDFIRPASRWRIVISNRSRPAVG